MTAELGTIPALIERRYRKTGYWAAVIDTRYRNSAFGGWIVFFLDSPIYFVTACTMDRRGILAVDPMHEAFRTFCLNSPQRGAWVGRYVLLPDHLHLFVCLEEIPLSNWMKSLKNSLSKSLRAAGYEDPHWQKRFFDHLLRSGESYSQKWDYFRENPVRAGLVDCPEGWPYAGEIHDLEYRK